MANYFLKNSDATRVYRIEYALDGDGHVAVFNAHAVATGTAAVLPNGDPITESDIQVDLGQVLADIIINSLVVATLAEYRTRAKAMIDGEWS